MAWQQPQGLMGVAQEPVVVASFDIHWGIDLHSRHSCSGSSSGVAGGGLVHDLETECERTCVPVGAGGGSTGMLNLRQLLAQLFL